MKKYRFTGKKIIAAACLTAAFVLAAEPCTTNVYAADGKYMSFRYTEEKEIAATGFAGNNISIVSGTISANDTSNVGSKIKLDKGTAVKKLDSIVSAGMVHFETVFLTTATSKASLFLRILNSEGEPMIDIAQYGSSNLNLYIDRQTSGDEGAMAARFKGLTVKQWVKAEVDIDLDASKTEGHLVFDVVVYTTDSYESGLWKKFAEYDETVYLNSTTAKTTTGAASTKATVFDVASIELYNAGGTNYYDDMFFETVGGGTVKTLAKLELISAPLKTEYNVGDSFNDTGMELVGTYVYTFADGSTKEEKQVITKYEVDFDNGREGKQVPITIKVDGKSVSFFAEVCHNPILDYIEADLVSFIDNKLVVLEDDNSILINKRQIKLPVKSEDDVKLSWAVKTGSADVEGNILTIEPSQDKETEVILTVTAETKNYEGSKVVFNKDIRLIVPNANTVKKEKISFDTEENIKVGLKAMYDRGLFKGQEKLASVSAVLSNREQFITAEELAAILVNMFEVDTTYTKTVIDREDVAYDKWYTDYVIAAFQLSLEPKTSRIEKKLYGIGCRLTREDVLYMVSRIAAVDQTTLPVDYAEQMFK